MDKYHLSVYENPTPHLMLRLGLAQTLEKLSPKTSANYRQAAVQYQAYESLSPNLTPEEKTKMDKRIAELQNKAAKLNGKGEIELESTHRKRAMNCRV